MDDRITILDVNVMSPIRRVSSGKGCGLLSWIAEYYNMCMISQEQYQKSPCKRYECFCIPIEDGCDFSSEDVFAFFYDNAGSMMKILSDFTDGKIVYFAFFKSALVVSSDRGVLQACRICNIDRLCFKAFMVNFHNKCSILELHGGEFDFGLLFDRDSENPFHSFFKNTRCKQCCDGECEAISKGQKLETELIIPD